VAGVIGADVLSGFVLDVQYAPCHAALWRPGEAPAMTEGRGLPMAVSPDGKPILAAIVSDDVQTREGPFVLATGLDVAARLADDQAAAPGIAKPIELEPGGVALRPLRALSFQGELWENLDVGLVPRTDLPPDALGEIGPAVLARWRLRFDFPRGLLTLAPVQP
jgi:hypothetical protein